MGPRHVQLLMSKAYEICACRNQNIVYHTLYDAGPGGGGDGSASGGLDTAPCCSNDPSRLSIRPSTLRRREIPNALCRRMPAELRWRSFARLGSGSSRSTGIWPGAGRRLGEGSAAALLPAAMVSEVWLGLR